MSTISFPDWINSLSPQSTIGKEVYQQDGSTPSRGDLDDKASLSGGENANFDVIPWVDGDPIIARGSNSDGEWVRFFNGLQICTLTDSRPWFQFGGSELWVTRMSWDFPNDFTSIPSVAWPSVAGTTNRDRTSAPNKAQLRVIQDEVGIGMESISATISSNVRLTWMAIGRWK